MSKKRRTKRQKIAAKLREKALLQSGVDSANVQKEMPCQEEDSSTIINYVRNNAKAERADTANYSLENIHIGKQLLKTIIIALAIVSLELVIYFKLN